MTEEQLNKGCYVQRRIVYAEQEIDRFKRLRDDIAKSKGYKEEMSIIEVFWQDFHMFSQTSDRANAIRARIMTLAAELVEEELQALNKELIELQKALDEI